MSSAIIPPDLGGRLSGLVLTVMSEIRPNLVRAALSGQRGESENKRHRDNFLSVHDLWMHERYRDLLAEVVPSFVYASEEGEPQIIGADADPDLCIIVDPLDTSELAVRALNGYTHVLVYSRSLSRPIAAVVGDIFHHVQLYVAERNDAGEDHAYVVTRDGDRHDLVGHPPKRLSESIVTNFLMRPTERFLPLSRQTALIDALDVPDDNGKSHGRIGLDFGSVGLCHVAAGFTEAVIEFAKGFAIWDLVPGHYILESAGGVVVDLDGNVVPLDYKLYSRDDIEEAMNTRQKFVATGSIELARDIVRTLRQ